MDDAPLIPLSLEICGSLFGCLVVLCAFATLGWSGCWKSSVQVFDCMSFILLCCTCDMFNFKKSSMLYSVVNGVLYFVVDTVFVFSLTPSASFWRCEASRRCRLTVQSYDRSLPGDAQLCDNPLCVMDIFDRAPGSCMSQQPLVVFVHGGAWHRGDHRNHMYVGCLPWAVACSGARAASIG